MSEDNTQAYINLLRSLLEGYKQAFDIASKDHDFSVQDYPVYVLEPLCRDAEILHLRQRVQQIQDKTEDDQRAIETLHTANEGLLAQLDALVERLVDLGQPIEDVWRLRESAVKSQK